MNVMHEISRNAEEGAAATRVATLHDLILAIDSETSLPAKRRADMRSAVRRLADVVGLPLESTPCDPRLFAERLATTSAASARMSPRRLANCKSLLDAAFAFADQRFGRRRAKVALRPDFSAILKLVPSRWDRLCLRRLFHFAGERGLQPDEIDARAFDEFDQSLAQTMLKNPRAFGHRVRHVWNALCTNLEGWPGKSVPVPSFVDHWVLAKDAFPSSLWADLDGYLAMRMKKNCEAIDDLLTEEELFSTEEIERAPPIRPSTAALIAYRVRQFASALVASGHLTAAEMTSLKVLVAPATVNAGLKFFVQRSGKIRNSQTRGIANDLKMIAKLWVKSAKADLDKFDLLVSRTRPKHEGLPDSARRAIAAFRDIENVRAFLQLPQAILAEAERQVEVTRKIANEVAAALWMQICQRAPLRINNLLHTRLETNLLRSHAGKNAKVSLFYPEEEVKNGKPLEVPLSATTVRMLDLYMKKYRPALVSKPSPWLFPTEDGGPKRASVMSADVQRLMLKKIGFRINPHSFRHVAAKLYLSAHPGDYETVQRILGHRRRDTTVKYYVDLQSEEAFRHFDNVLLKLVDHDTKGAI